MIGAAGHSIESDNFMYITQSNQKKSFTETAGLEEVII